MRKTISIIIPLIVAIMVTLVSIPVMAAKPLKQDGIPIGNGFPSGMHFNLNIHGHTTFDCASMEPELDGYFGNSVHIPEVGQSTITYAISKQSSITELKVEDACAFDDGRVKVLLPYKVWYNDSLVKAEGFYVYGRIRGKPNNDNGDPSRIIVSQNQVTQVSDPLGETELPLGAIIASNVYIPDGEEFVRFDAPKAKGKGGAVDITRLFEWSGWICDPILDIDLDGDIDDDDVPADAWTQIVNAGKDPQTYDDGPFGDDSDTINLIGEWLAFQADLWSESYPGAVFCEYYQDVQIWDLADIFGEAESEQTIDNYGTKLLQIRFYPIATTVFGPTHPNK
jgi:hypothetical protein